MPRNIESDLADLELRHKRHQARMEEQRLAKITARECHRQGWHRRRLVPITLI